MAILGFELEEIVRLLALVEAQGLDEFIYEEDGRYLRIRGPRRAKIGHTAASAPVASAPSHRPAAPRAIAPPPAQPASGAEPTMPAEGQIALVAPMVGIFYRAEKPGAPPLIKVGDHVEVDQTVGIIEAMKVFSEFKSDHAGTVVAIPGQDGQLVQTGAPLFILKPD